MLSTFGYMPDVVIMLGVMQFFLYEGPICLWRSVISVLMESPASFRVVTVLLRPSSSIQELFFTSLLLK